MSQSLQQYCPPVCVCVCVRLYYQCCGDIKLSVTLWGLDFFAGQRINPRLEALNVSWCKVLWSAASRTECSCTAAEALLRYQGHTGGMKTDEGGQGRIIMRSSLLALVCVCTLSLSLHPVLFISISPSLGFLLIRILFKLKLSWATIPTQNIWQCCAGTDAANTSCFLYKHSY